MNATTETSLSSEALEQLRGEVRLLQQEEGLSLADIARDAGIAYGTFTPWMTGKYAGDASGVGMKVSRWLGSRRERRQTQAVLPSAPVYLPTPTATSIMETLSFAQAAPDFAVIVGGPGIGKTTSIREYEKRSPNVHVVTAEPCVASPINMLAAIAEAIGLIERSSNRLSRAIVARLRNTNALLVIDEAQHLESKALDQLRTLHDLAGCGIAVSGNETVFARLQGGDARNAQFAQLHSRVGKRLVQPKSRAQDICQLVQAWGVEPQSEVAKLLTQIAAKPGALRNLTKVMRLASMLAAGAGTAVDARLVKLAWGQLSSSAIEG